MTEAESFVESSTATVDVPFDVRYYLAERAARSSFVMVEIGHGGAPAAYCQPNFIGQRMYVGIEAWMRDTTGKQREHLQSLQTEHGDQNIVFIEHNLDPGTPELVPSDSTLMKYKRTYNPTTL